MYHEAHIRLVYSHAEGNGSHDDIYFLHQKLVLVLRPGPGIQPRMVRKRLDTVYVQKLRKLFHLLPAQAIYDA